MAEFWGRLVSGRMFFLGLLALQRGMALLILPFTVRALGIAAYGQAATLVTVFILAGMVFGLGSDFAAYRFADDRTGEVPGQRFKATGAIALLAPVALGAVSGALVLAGGVTIAGVPPVLLTISILAAGIQAAGGPFPAAVLRIRGNPIQFARFMLVSAGAVAVAKLLLVVVLHLGVLGWVLSDLLAAVVVYLQSVPIYFAVLRGSSPFSLVRRAGRGVLGFSLPLVPAVISQWASSLSDRLLVVLICGVTGAGRYALIAQVAAIGTAVIDELATYILPRLRNAMQQEGMASLVRRLFPVQLELVALTAMGIASGALVFGEPLFGASFKGLAAPAVLLCVMVLFQGIFHLLADVSSVGQGRSGLKAVISAAGAAISIVLNLLILPVAGYIGAVYSAIAVSVISCLVMVFTVATGREALREVARASWPIGAAVVMLGLMVVSISAFSAATPAIWIGAAGLLLFLGLRWGPFAFRRRPRDRA